MDSYRCLHNSVSMLVNGSFADIFGSSKGLHQGDPFSSILFLVMMEVFSRMLKRMEGASLLPCFKIGGRRGGGECVSHLLFTGGTILFLFYFFYANVEQILCVQLLLLCFQAVIGLKVNISKSEMVPIGEVNNVHAWQRFWVIGLDLCQ